MLEVWSRYGNAAPDLLAAVKLGREAVMESFAEDMSNDDQLLADARLRDIDAAIAKAEGRS